LKSKLHDLSSKVPTLAVIKQETSKSSDAVPVVNRIGEALK